MRGTTEDRVNGVFRELAPSIFEAWLMTAPKRPDDTCVVMVVIPVEAGLFQHDRPALETAIRSLFMVNTAEIVDSLMDDLPLPGVRVTGLSWSQHLAHVKAMDSGAA